MYKRISMFDAVCICGAIDAMLLAPIVIMTNDLLDGVSHFEFENTLITTLIFVMAFVAVIFDCYIFRLAVNDD